MSTTGRKCLVSTAARAFSMYAGTWAVLFASLGMLGCVAVEDPTDSSALASQSHESMMRDSLGTELAPISAAIARSNAHADLDLNLLARVEIQPNEMLEIYEPVPGRIVISGAGAPTGEALMSPHAIGGRSVEEIWELATASAEMPGELRAAIARARERMDAGGPLLQEGIEPPEAPRSGALATATPVAAGLQPPATSSGYCDTEYFSTYFLGTCETIFDYEICLNNWWNGYHAWTTGADYVYTNVCPATGTVVLDVDGAGGTGGQWTVPQNTYRVWSRDDVCSIFDPYCRDDVYVEEAQNDRFHFRFYVFH